MPLSRFYPNFDVRRLIAFCYTIIFRTFNIVGDNLTFMVAKIQPNEKDSEGNLIYFSPILYLVQIPVGHLDALLEQILSAIENKTLWYRSPDKRFDLLNDDIRYSLSSFWSTTLEVKRMANDDVMTETLGDYNVFHTLISKRDIRRYAYVILQAYFSQISSLATDLKVRFQDLTNITITKYWDKAPVREMGEKEFWATHDRYVGQVLRKLASFGNNVVLSNTDYNSIKPTDLFN